MRKPKKLLSILYLCERLIRVILKLSYYTFEARFFKFKNEEVYHYDFRWFLNFKIG